MKNFFSKVLQCVKLEKINNFNKFIWLYWKMKKNIYIFFFGGFPVARMRRKKKGYAQKAVGWATAHLSHDTMDCIVTQS